MPHHVLGIPTHNESFYLVAISMIRISQQDAQFSNSSALIKNYLWEINITFTSFWYSFPYFSILCSSEGQIHQIFLNYSRRLVLWIVVQKLKSEENFKTLFDYIFIHSTLLYMLNPHAYFNILQSDLKLTGNVSNLSHITSTFM